MVIQIEGWDKVVAKYGAAAAKKAMRAALDASAEYTAGRVRAKIPAVTGHARSSVTVSIENEASGKVFAKQGGTVAYMRVLEEGSGIHGPKKAPIKPKSAKVLAWHPRTATGAPKKSKAGASQYGGMIVRRSVKGQRPKAMFHKTYTGDRAKIFDRYRAAWRKSFGV